MRGCRFCDRRISGKTKCRICGWKACGDCRVQQMKQEPEGWSCNSHQIDSPSVSNVEFPDYKFPTKPRKRSILEGFDHIPSVMQKQLNSEFGVNIGAPPLRVLEVDLWLPPAVLALHQIRSGENTVKSKRPSSIHMKAHVELGEQLGKGATSVVFRGRIRETGEIVALKQLTYKVSESTKIQSLR